MATFSDSKGSDWNTMAKMYKQLTVGVAMRPIETLLNMTNSLQPFSSSTGIHDNGCGPAPILSRLLQTYGKSIPASAKLSCSDFSAAMIEQVRLVREEELGKDAESPWKRVEASVMDAMDLKGMEANSRSHITAGWVYFLTADPKKCLNESLRVLSEGGVLGCSSWKGSDWLEMMGFASEVKAGAKLPDIPENWMSVKGLTGEMESAGFRDVQVVEVPVSMTFESYDALVELLTETMPFMKQVLKDFSGEEKDRLKVMIREAAMKKAPSQPYALHGVSLVAVGRK